MKPRTVKISEAEGILDWEGWFIYVVPAMRGLLVGTAVPLRRVDSAQPVPFELSAILKEVLEVMPLIFFSFFPK